MNPFYLVGLSFLQLHSVVYASNKLAIQRNTLFSVNYWMYAISRFIVAACISGLYVAAFTYAMEMVATKHRSFTGVNIQAQFAVGYVILGFLSLIPQLHDWRYFQAAITLFSFFAVAASFYVPESPSWQFTKGKVDDALITCENILERKTGDTSFPQHVLQDGESLTNNRWVSNY